MLIRFNTRHICHTKKNRQSGQAALEFAIVFLLFAALITGLFEMTRVFRTKHTLNAATFMAARTGIVNNALAQPMNSELENGMIELFIRGGRSLEELGEATVRARAFGVQLGQLGGGVEIINPTREMHRQLHINQRVLRADEEDYDVHSVIPNDNLRWRPRVVARSDEGETNLQDANLLKIRSLWCHRLVVPLLDRIIYETINTAIFFNAAQGTCTALSESSRNGNNTIDTGFYIAIAADATLRMQSPVVADNLP